MRKGIGIVLGSLLWLGCVNQPLVQPPPEVVSVDRAYETVKAPLNYYVSGELPRVLFDVQRLFVERSIAVQVFVEGTVARMRSVPAEEASGPGYHRRITYDIKASRYLNRPGCIWVEVRWFIERRPYGEWGWNMEPFDPSYVPELSPEIVQLLDANPCK